MSLHSIAAGKITCTMRESDVIRYKVERQMLTKLSLISMLLSLVSAGAAMVKFLMTAAIAMRSIICARFLATTDTGTCPKGHHVLIHVGELSL